MERTALYDVLRIVEKDTVISYMERVSVVVLGTGNQNAMQVNYSGSQTVHIVFKCNQC